MAKFHIDADALYGALMRCGEREITTRHLAREIVVSPPLLSRLANGYRPHADGVRHVGPVPQPAGREIRDR